MNPNALKRFLTPITARIRRMIAGAVIKAVNDDTDLQKMMIQSIGGGTYDNVEHFGQYGLCGNPPTGLDAIVAERNGKYVVVAVGDRKYRIRGMKSGDVALYDDKGQTITLTQSGIKLSDKYQNMISMGTSGIVLNGVLIKQSGEMTTPSTLTTADAITAGGTITGPDGLIGGVTLTDGAASNAIAISTIPIPAAVAIGLAGYIVHAHTAPSGGGKTSPPV